MKRILIVILSLSLICSFIVGCSDKEQDQLFKFTGEIKKILVIGRGLKHELGSHTIDNDAEVNVIKDAMLNASVSTQKHTDQGPLFELEVIFEDGSKENINLWYSTEFKEGRFSTDAMYTMNVRAVPALIDFFESIKYMYFNSIFYLNCSST